MKKENRVTQASKSDNNAIRELLYNSSTLETSPALMLRWKDELTVKHIGLLGCASVLTLACFSIETRVYLLTTSAPTVCFPFSILNTDKGKWINVDWIQPGELLTHSLWCCMCTCEQVYAVLSGFVLLQGVWAMCLKMMGVCLHMWVWLGGQRISLVSPSL